MDQVEKDRTDQIEGVRSGLPSLFTCPDCGGTLWQINEPELLQFRCHVGHILTGEGLLQDQTNAAENALWYAIRTLVDKSVLAFELEKEARKQGDEAAAQDFEAQAQAAARRAQALKEVAESG